MVSKAKRMRYVSENECSSSEEDIANWGCGSKTKNGTKKWLSKNAIMARENRLKKKLYISNLEKEIVNMKTSNSNFSKLVESQSLLITDLKKEIKYLKSVIINSADISNLMKSIHNNTGMSVSSSLDQTLSLDNYVCKPKLQIAKKTPHPWDEKYPSYPTPELSISDNLLPDLELDDFLDQTDKLIEPIMISDEHLKEHNYMSTKDLQDDVGDEDHHFRRTCSLPSDEKFATAPWGIGGRLSRVLKCIVP